MSTSKHILLVEDEMLIALDMESTLADVGHRVTTASTVDEAMQVLSGGGIDMAVLDFHLREGDTSTLPGTYNLRACRSLCAREPRAWKN